MFKWGANRDSTVRRTQFVDNWGSGLWLDYDNQRVTVDQILSARNQGTGASLELNPGPITISNSKFCSNETGIEDARSNYVTLSNNQTFGNSTAQLMFTGPGRQWTCRTGRRAWSTCPIGLPRLHGQHFPREWADDGCGGVAAVGAIQLDLHGHLPTDYPQFEQQVVSPGPNERLRARRLNGGINWWTGDYTLLKSTSHWNYPSNPNSPNNEQGGSWADPGTLSCTMP